MLRAQRVVLRPFLLVSPAQDIKMKRGHRGAVWADWGARKPQQTEAVGSTFEPDLRSGLLKVVTSSQRLVYAFLFHQQERHAIHQRPVLAGIFLAQFHAFLEETLRNEMHRRVRMGLDAPWVLVNAL